MQQPTDSIYEPPHTSLPGEMRHKTKKKSASRSLRLDLLFAIIAASMIRWVLFEPFNIPTPSMEGTLLVGDYLFVSKLHYGPITPKTPLQVPFTQQTIWGTSIPSYLNWLQLPRYRFPGFSQVTRNDAVVFHYPAETEHPTDLRMHYIKRCIALPGDVLSLKDRRVYINDVLQPLLPHVQHRYYIHTDAELSDSFFREHAIAEFAPVPDGYIVLTTARIAEQIEKLDYVSKTEIVLNPSQRVSDDIFPDAHTFSWNEDNYGPVQVPAKGMTIDITPQNLMMYKQAITWYEGNDNVEVKDNTLFINDQPVQQYTFTQNYYFMMGDNRHNSLDSRFWGFVPEDHVVGKAVLVWWSTDPQESWTNPFDKIRWNRVFTLIK
jgi:signal peptidase I